MYKRFKNGILGIIYIIWLITFCISFFGRWNDMISKIFIPLSSVLTVICIIHIIKEKKLAAVFGICCMYLGCISIIGAYKLAHYQFELSTMWFVVMLVLYVIIVGVQLFYLCKKKPSSKIQHKSKSYALGTGVTAYFIISMIVKNDKIISSNSVAIPILIVMLLLIAVASVWGTRNLVANYE